jgi:uncharacterized membrane protein YeaQ/YmgE (transglycosylase-associated protein family)
LVVPAADAARSPAAATGARCQRAADEGAIPARRLLTWAEGLRRRLSKEQTMVNLIIWLVVGGFIGWVASLVMHTDGQQGILLNIVVGVVGAALAGWFIAPLVGAGTINQGSFSLLSLIVSLLGAILLLAIVNLVRRSRVP